MSFYLCQGILYINHFYYFSIEKNIILFKQFLQLYWYISKIVFSYYYPVIQSICHEHIEHCHPLISHPTGKHTVLAFVYWDEVYHVYHVWRSIIIIMYGCHDHQELAITAAASGHQHL